MIRVVIEIDIDDPRIGADRRRITASAPDGYTISELRCMGWGRDFDTGSVHMDVSLKIASPADLLPRIDVYGTSGKKHERAH